MQLIALDPVLLLGKFKLLVAAQQSQRGALLRGNTTTVVYGYTVYSIRVSFWGSVQLIPPHSRIIRLES